jgi:O-Antigen ligase
MLERAVQLLIVGSIVTALLAAGSLLDVLDEARKARWLFLLLLAGAAAAYALPRVREVRLGWPYRLAAALTALALLSAAWSSRPGLTFARGVSLGLILGAAAAVAIGATGRLDSMRRVVDAIVAAGAVVAVGGLLVLAFDHDRAVQPASAQEAARFQGLGGGPNVAPMLFAVTLPLAVSIAVEARTPLRRWIAVAVALLLLGSIVASGSRGAIVAACAGLVPIALVLPRRRLALAGVVALLVVSAGLTRIPQTAATDPVLHPEFGVRLPLGPNDADFILPLQSEIGFELAKHPQRRSLLETSGRTVAWRGALHQVDERPIAGYGFGTEERVFVDRFYLFLSDRVENSYLGTVLQLGVVGLAALLGLVAAFALAAVRVLRSGGPERRRVAAAAAGVGVAALVLAVTQSFLTSVGSPATAPAWIAAFLVAVLAPQAVRECEQREGREQQQQAA